MGRFSRRQLLQLGAGASIAGAVPSAALGRGPDDGSVQDHEGPELDKWVQPMPRLDIREPDGWLNGAPYHEVTQQQFTTSLHPDLPETTLWGYDGQFPGPIIAGRRGRPLAFEMDNSELPDEHLFTIDERIKGTTTENYPTHDGPVPSVRNSVHFHGLNVPSSDDGQADMWISPDGVTGPRRTTDVQVMPNEQPRLTTTYHDHTRGISRLNNYAGLVGPYYIRERNDAERQLPQGEYDVTLVLVDRSFNEDGSLYYPNEFVAMHGGEKALVNGAVWPYMEVEPRRYRFRLLNPSNGRTWGLRLRNDTEGESELPEMKQYSAGHGYLEDVVGIGPYGDVGTLLVSPFERAEFVVDFSDFAGQTFTVTNHALFPYPHGEHHNPSSEGSRTPNRDPGTESPAPDLDEVMQFRVTEESVSDPSTPTEEIDFPTTPRPDPEETVTEREVTMQMEMIDDGTMVHRLNGRATFDPIEFEPELDTTETWIIKNDSLMSHPLHLHLVRFWVEGKKDLGRPEYNDPRPAERSEKDTVMILPGKEYKLTVDFGDYPGIFPFHCHNLEHEDHEMMRPMEVVETEASLHEDESAEE
ncbi:multicopper oxidase family protein [Halovivax cerinus]|uniref:Multicopper oxidase family protein n=1 Tax=Halovivax cerinus TaxID=1487865 RepID=A0ABD5NKM1_9EURY|nr:multicopper oxidase domain-containing protein [Halovivax cerinus]